MEDNEERDKEVQLLKNFLTEVRMQYSMHKLTPFKEFRVLSILEEIHKIFFLKIRLFTNYEKIFIMSSRKQRIWLV